MRWRKTCTPIQDEDRSAVAAIVIQLPVSPFGHPVVEGAIRNPTRMTSAVKAPVCTSRMSMKDFLKSRARDRLGAEFYRDDENLIKIPWVHASKKNWKEERHCQIFKDWAKNTGKPSDDPKKCKANFRCALNSISGIEEVEQLSHKNGSDGFRVFRLGSERKPIKRKKTGKKGQTTFHSLQKSSTPSIFESPPISPQEASCNFPPTDLELEDLCKDMDIDLMYSEILNEPPSPKECSQTFHPMIPVSVAEMEIDDGDDDDAADYKVSKKVRSRKS